MKLSEKFPSIIKNIIFDFGGVIMDINISKTIEAFAKLNIDGLKVEDIITSHKTFLHDLEVGAIIPQQFIEMLHNEYPGAKEISDKQLWDAWNALLQPYDSARIKMLSDLSQNYNLYLLSNTNLPHRIKFREMFRAQFDENFDDLFIKSFYSDEMHMRKPDKEIYQQVISEARIDPSVTLFIDDNEANITSARDFGLNAYHLTGGERITNLFVEGKTENSYK